ncbi:MAG: hypothetical protein IJ646_11545, partial [Clostridia bacterium]|nr:hypothetical protein [Clostridia bacterium]
LLDGIRGGEAAMAPAESRVGTSCQWCDLRDACLFDPKLDAGCVRRFRPLRGDQALELMKLEANDEGGDDNVQDQ